MYAVRVCHVSPCFFFVDTCVQKPFNMINQHALLLLPMHFPPPNMFSSAGTCRNDLQHGTRWYEDDICKLSIFWRAGVSRTLQINSLARVINSSPHTLFFRPHISHWQYLMQIATAKNKQKNSVKENIAFIGAEGA